MMATDQTFENLTLAINQEIHVQAPLDITFAALLEQLGPRNSLKFAATARVCLGFATRLG